MHHPTLCARRIGMILPSSNTTLESEIPQLLARQQAASGHRFSCHSARVPMQQLTAEALQRMNEVADAAVDTLCDAQVDVVLYASLAALMSQGADCMRETKWRLAQRAAMASQLMAPAVVTAAGALVDALQALGARSVSMIAPYRKELTERVSATLAEHRISVVQSRSLNIVDNADVGRLDPHKLLSLASQFDLSGCDALVLCACEQMPSLPVIEEAEQRLGLPVLSAATASVFAVLRRLDIEPRIEGAGSLLRPRVGALEMFA